MKSNFTLAQEFPVRIKDLSKRKNKKIFFFILIQLLLYGIAHWKSVLPTTFMVFSSVVAGIYFTVGNQHYNTISALYPSVKNIAYECKSIEEKIISYTESIQTESINVYWLMIRNTVIAFSSGVVIFALDKKSTINSLDANGYIFIIFSFIFGNIAVWNFLELEKLDTSYKVLLGFLFDYKKQQEV